MKNKRNVFILFAIVIIILGAVFYNNLNFNLTQLGTSKFYIKLPTGYDKKTDDFSEDQIAYFYKDDESVDFDVYQWSKEGKYTLDEEANYFASEYDTTATKIFVNNIDGFKYISKETYDNYVYTVINYMFDDGDDIVEISFWTINNKEELETVDKIINTLIKK